MRPSNLTTHQAQFNSHLDDPTLPLLFPHSHGLLTLHSFPTSHHLLPPTLKHSALLGVSGAGENNLGFRLKRKRFVIETVHLGVEGGVGERRTEPVVDVGRMLGVSRGVEGKEEVEGVEGVEGVEAVRDEGVERPRGPKEEKRVRGRVRFGEDVEVDSGMKGLEVESPPDEHDHGHGHGHRHEHGESKTPNGEGKRAGVRHDRMDLYDF